jgi:DNA invertase Pin-like site-specific DNA recombinase
MAVIGYARVSSAGQKLEAQREKLLDAGVERLYEEKKSGTNTDRPELQKALDFVREGDVFCITKIDRLARSAADLLNIVRQLDDKGVQFRVLDQNIDTTTNEGAFMLTMLAAFAQFETAIRADRQADGIAIAKARGTKFGRKAKATDDVAENIRTMRADGLMIREIMAKTGLSKATVYRALTPEAA